MTREADPAPDAEGTLKPAATRRSRIVRVIVWAVIAFAAVATTAGSLVYTEQSSFCPTCHEMRPYYSAWQTGAHADSAQCVQCHVDDGLLAHLAHKPIALKEVWDHFFDPRLFPAHTVELPDSRCAACHPSVAETTTTLFSHRKHAARAQCKDCHADSGHAVSSASLQAAGVLDSTVATPSIAPTGTTPSSIPRHPAAVCQRCHDEVAMECSTCHKAPHEDRGACSNCHEVDGRFVAHHPAGTECTECHEAPKNHFGADCATCHTPGTPFSATVFDHVSVLGQKCSKCHKAPSGHFGSDCAACHTPRVPFADTTFSHTTVTGQQCSKCHRAPSGHFGAKCSSCHTPSVAFAKTVFRHPAGTGTNCARCHRAPSGHYGSSCSSCHSTKVPFSKTTFSHPRTREHSWRSFACVKCHPNGYSTSYCTCHNGNPPKDD